MDVHADSLTGLLRNDRHRWHLLGAVAALDLPDCWIGAGFIRNAVWEGLHRQAGIATGFDGATADVDVIWFDRSRMDEAEDRTGEAILRAAEPGIRWSVKNQARMHRRNGDAPYESATDAMRYWPETATAVAARRVGPDRCEIAAPYGLDDLFGLILRPTPGFRLARNAIFRNRVTEKGWTRTWPLLRHGEA